MKFLRVIRLTIGAVGLCALECLPIAYAQENADLLRNRAAIIKEASKDHPSIFSATEYLTTVFSQGLKIPDEDRRTLEKIFHGFDPSILSPKEKELLEVAGKNMLLEAQDMKDAVYQIRSFGFDQKIISAAGHSPPKYSLASMMGRNPLPSFPVGQWTQDPQRLAINSNVYWGRTAGELFAGGEIKTLEVTHGTPTYGDWKSITASPDKRPNALYSGGISEGRVGPRGFFLFPATPEYEKAYGPYLIKFRLDPNAREGIDFGRQASEIMIYNRDALTIIDDFGELTPMGLLERLRNYHGPLSPLHLGPLEKHRLKFEANHERLSAEEMKRVNQMFADDFESGRLSRLFIDELKWGYVDALTPRNHFRLNELTGGHPSLAILDEAQKEELQHWDWTSSKVDPQLQMTEAEMYAERIKLNLSEARRPGWNIPKNFTRLDDFLVSNTAWTKSPYAGRVASVLLPDLLATQREYSAFHLLKSGVLSPDKPETIEFARSLVKVGNIRDAVFTDILLSKEWIDRKEIRAMLREVCSSADYSGWARGVELLPKLMTDPRLIESGAFGELVLELMPEISKPHPYYDHGRNITKELIEGFWKKWLRSFSSSQWKNSPIFPKIREFLMNYHDIHYLVAREMLGPEWAKTKEGPEMLSHLIKTGRSEGDIIESVLIHDEWAQSNHALEIFEQLVDTGKVDSQLDQLLAKSEAWRTQLGRACGGKAPSVAFVRTLRARGFRLVDSVGGPAPCLFKAINKALRE